MAGTIEDRIHDLVSPLVESLGLSLWGVRFCTGAKHARLQIYIDGPEGVSADACADATRLISPALDAADLIGPAYILEVSSPGLDRILFTLEQLKASTGSQIRLELRLPMEGRKRFEGRLQEVGEDGTFRLEDKQDGLKEMAFSNVASCRIVPDFSAR